MNKTLIELYQEKSGKVSIKWELYLKEYDRILAEYQDSSVNILEIGVQNGGSLEAWSQYFKNAQSIVGVDIDQNCQNLVYTDNRIQVIIGDCCQQEINEKIIGKVATYDLIFDDGSHRSADIIKAFLLYFPKLSVDGKYIIEDLHCSYWSSYEGGLFDPYSSIAFIKKLIDIINFQHWQNGVSIHQFLETFLIKSGVDPITVNIDFFNQIHSIEIINSLCIIKKKAVQDNSIRELTVKGSDDSVVSEDAKLVIEKAINLQNQNENIFSTEAYQNNADFDLKLTAIRDKLLSSKAINVQKDQDIAELRHENYDLHKNIYQITTQLNQFAEGIQSLNQTIESKEEIIRQINMELHEARNQLIKFDGGVFIPLNSTMNRMKKKLGRGFKKASKS